MDTDSSTIHPAFEKLRAEHIGSLALTVEEYRHKRTGAQHYHLAADNSENVFLVALRTAPQDSTGVAHVLEHTVLCGSTRYPVRDPFFMMMRRSLNTFVNALTGSDWTAYPFSSQNPKDFYNLMDIYLDAVFFPLLNELDFAQEGCRIEFAEPDNPNSELVFKGVVFNEMKGVMSSPINSIWRSLSRYLFPTTTYHYNSGGDPEEIPNLTYEHLKAFYRTYYHPSNAIFMTYGDLPVYEHHRRIEDKALAHFERSDLHSAVPDEKRYEQPVTAEETYALNSEEANGDPSHILLAWLLGYSTDLEELLKAQLLSGVLLGNSASPLRHALETTELGSAPSPLCGVEDSNREISFVCGIEGSSPERAQAFESLVFEVLNEVVNNGVPQERVEAVLHQIELSQREIGGDGLPYGLQLILQALSPAIHRGDPLAALNIDPVLERLRQEIKHPDFIRYLARQCLLNNTHRVRLTMRPDTELNERHKRAEAQRLAAIKASLSEVEKDQIDERAKQLAARQAQQDDPELLPKVGLEDIPAELPIPQGEQVLIGDTPVTFFEQGTNGLVYQEILVDLPDLEEELLEVLPFYTACLTELGCGDRDYLETQAWQDSISGGIHAYTSSRGAIDDEQVIKGHLILSGKALAHNHGKLNELMQQFLESPRFDELSRIRELIAQQRARREQSIAENGHGLAMAAATSGMSPVAAMTHKLRGLEGIRLLKQLDDRLNDEAHVKALVEKFKRLYRRIAAAPRQFLIVGDGQHRSALQSTLEEGLRESPKPGEGWSPFKLPPIREPIKQFWTGNTQVSFCAKAYPTVPVEHPDAAPLTVLEEFLENGYLHGALRERGGAYGAGASQDSGAAAFRLFSYRDPRVSGTLDDFDRAIEWLLHEEHQERQLEEAILGVISSIDKPGSPAGETKDAFHNSLYGRIPEQRRDFRRRVLNVSLEDLQRVGKTYLDPGKASVAVLTYPGAWEEYRDLGLEPHNL